MRVTVRLFGELRRYLPRGQELVELEVPDAATPAFVLHDIGIDPSDVWAIRVNKQVVAEQETLHDGDRLELFEPVGGG